MQNPEWLCGSEIVTGASVNLGVGSKWVKIQSVSWTRFWKHNISALLFNGNSKPCFICCLWTHWIDSIHYWRATTRREKWFPSQPYSLYLWSSLKSPFSGWTLSLMFLPTSFILSLFCSVGILFSMTITIITRLGPNFYIHIHGLFIICGAFMTFIEDKNLNPNTN